MYWIQSAIAGTANVSTTHCVVRHKTQTKSYTKSVTRSTYTTFSEINLSYWI